MTPQVPTWLNSTALTGFLVVAAMILMAVTGLVILAKSGKGDMKKAASQMGTAMIGGVMIGFALLTGVAWLVIQSTVTFFVNK